VKYALEHKAVILFDAAYEAYITDPAIPHSIYEIPARANAPSSSAASRRTAASPARALRLHVVPKSLNAYTKTGEAKPLHPLWSRRMTTKFNGVSYIVQRAAEALYSPEGKAQVALIEHYLGNAEVLRKGAKKAGLKVFGGVNAPYIWVRTPQGVTSWQAFDKILGDANVVITPGSGFGSKGEGFFRISAFNSRANAEKKSVRKAKWSVMLATQSQTRRARAVGQIRRLRDLLPPWCRA
jgi:LL-diaminopimelate aminotransferase